MLRTRLLACNGQHLVLGGRCGCEQLRHRLIGNMSLRELKNVIGIVPLKELRQPLGLVGAEADHGPWLSPRLAERIAHVANYRLSRCLPEALERSPTLPGRFQARSRVMCAADQLWITHRAIPLKIVSPGISPDRSQRGERRLRQCQEPRHDHLRQTALARWDRPPILRTSSATRHGQRHKSVPPSWAMPPRRDATRNAAAE